MLATKVNFLPSNAWYIFPKPCNSFTTAVNQCVCDPFIENKESMSFPEMNFMKDAEKFELCKVITKC